MPFPIALSSCIPASSHRRLTFRAVCGGVSLGKKIIPLLLLSSQHRLFLFTYIHTYKSEVGQIYIVRGSFPSCGWWSGGRRTCRLIKCAMSRCSSSTVVSLCWESGPRWDPVGNPSTWDQHCFRQPWKRPRAMGPSWRWLPPLIVLASWGLCPLLYLEGRGRLKIEISSPSFSFKLRCLHLTIQLPQ